MRWRQMGAAVVVGGAVAIGSVQYGFSTIEAVIVGLIFSIIARWVLATIGRTRYWRRQNSRNYYTRTCPDCGRRRWRMSGDWFLRCYDCGWVEGWPVVRWLTRSVPARQLRRSSSIAGILIVGIFASILLFHYPVSPDAVGQYGVTAVSAAGNSLAIMDDGNTDDQLTDTSTTTITTQSQVTTSRTRQTAVPATTTTHLREIEELNATLVERLVWKYTNQRREKHGLNAVRYSESIAELAESHAKNMAKHDYIGHTQPDGDTMVERYEPVCGQSSGENAFSAWYNRDMVSWHTNKTVHLDSERKLAQYFVNGWMNSSGHRENILRNRWTRSGVGVYKSDSGEVYAAQTFC